MFLVNLYHDITDCTEIAVADYVECWKSKCVVSVVFQETFFQGKREVFLEWKIMGDIIMNLCDVYVVVVIYFEQELTNLVMRDIY